MSIYRRGASGIWWVRFQTNGREIRTSTGTSDRKKALEIERRMRSQADEDIHCIRMQRSLKRTFGEAVVHWLESREYPTSMESHIRSVTAELKDVQLTDILPAVEAMRAKYAKQGLSPLTVNRRLAVVKRVLTLAHRRWKWINEPLASHIELCSEKGSMREVFLTAEEIDVLISAIPDEAVRDFALVASLTGMRRGELLALKPSHLRPGCVLLTSDITKSSKPRAIPLLEEVEEILKKRLPWKFNHSAVEYQFRLARSAVGMGHVRFHDLRHSFASRLVENPEVPMGVVRDLLGHSSLSITSRYSHLRRETLARAVNTLRRDVQTTPEKEGVEK